MVVLRLANDSAEKVLGHACGCAESKVYVSQLDTLCNTCGPYPALSPTYTPMTVVPGMSLTVRITLAGEQVDASTFGVLTQPMSSELHHPRLRQNASPGAPAY